MPELKHNFLKGRMNKDLDERLVPNGEYRDALNIEVSTSEGSDVGTVQTTMGNIGLSSIPVISSTKCVGKILDEKNDKLYWLISESGTRPSPFSPTAPPPVYGDFYVADIIAEYNDTNGDINPVVVDTFYTAVNLTDYNAHQGNGDWISVSSSSWSGAMDYVIYPGMEIDLVDQAGDSIFPEGTVVVDVNLSGWQVKLSNPPLNPSGLDTAPDYSIYKLKFESFNRPLNFQNDGIITGINIVDDFLFWTDNNSEPKKVNIRRGKEERILNPYILPSPDFKTHSMLTITSTTSLTPNTLKIATGNMPWSSTSPVPLKEEHVTVIRKSPLTTLNLEMKNTPRTSVIGGPLDYSNPTGAIIDGTTYPNQTITTAVAASAPSIAAGAPSNNFNPFWDYTNAEMKDTAWINFGGPDSAINQVALSNPNDSNSWAPGIPIYNEGDTLIIETTTVPIETIRAKVTQKDNLHGSYNLDILSFDPMISATDNVFDVMLEQPDPLFEYKFPRFSFRYKYEDGEYSAFAPFSEIAFLPEKFEFVPKKGYNLGMTNHVRKLVIKDFVDDKLLPPDVLSIDILYKESGSPNIYTVKTITRDDFEWDAISEDIRIATGKRGYVNIESEMIHAILPSNQLLRPWDNIPRKALAQEITKNRLVYGNYLQNYDMRSSTGEPININLELTSTSKIVGESFNYTPAQRFSENAYRYDPSKSVKTLRTYQLGVVYRDKYGRETPVFSTSTKEDSNDTSKASLFLEKHLADQQNKLRAQIKNKPPAWAESFKFFIKETSNEYYNLAMDRWYDAEDDNIWLSFPSSERNKIDIDTFLILKKEKDNSNFVHESGRYKILAIENEAPTFVKTTEQLYGRVVDNTGKTIFRSGANTGFPIEDRTFMYVDSTALQNMGWKDSLIDAGKPNLYMRMRTANTTSNWYKIAGFSLLNAISYYRVDAYKDIFGPDMNITTTNPSNVSTANIIGGLSMEVKQNIIEHRAEFDGRFFVKIYKDQLLIDRIIKPSLDAIEYTISDARNFGYINNGVEDNNPQGSLSVSGAAPSFTYGTSQNISWASTNNWTQGSSLGLVGRGWGNGSNRVKIKDDDENNSSGDGSSTNFWGPRRGWFIDQVPAFSSLDPVDWILSSSSPNQQIATTPYNSSNPRNTGGRGIHKDNYIHISYTKFGDQEHEPSGQTGSGGPFLRNLWESGSNTVSETQFIEKLCSPGTLWRWAEDPDRHIYKTLPGSNTTDDYGQSFGPNELWMGGSAIGRHGFNFHGYSGGNAIGAVSAHYVAFANRNQFLLKAERLFDGEPIGATGGLHNAQYTPVNNPSNDAWFDSDNICLAWKGTCSDALYNNSPQECLDANGTFTFDASAFYTGSISNAAPTLVQSSNYPTDPAPGLRQDGGAMDSTGNSTGSGFYKTTATCSGSAADCQPGQVTWEIIEPIVRGEDLEEASSNPAIWETEPKEDIGLDIYHEVGQVYPVELNHKTNEQYAPIGSVVGCWRPGVGTIILGGGAAGIGGFWTPPIKVKSWNDNILTLEDSTGSLFNNNTGFPLEHAIPGDVLTFQRADGSKTTAKLQYPNNWISPPGNPYEYTMFRNVHQGVKTLPWFNCYSFGNGVESDRIRDNYNQVTIDNGPKASTTLDEPYLEERRGSGLIYSGIYNSNSGINNLNQFVQAEKITKDLNPTYGSIQKLHTRDTNLITLCEDKILKILANKDALFNADGNVNLTATANVLGQTTPFVGEYGISKNPESFASESFRAYFTDKSRGAVLRLSQDGLTPISEVGMKDWFSDNLKITDSLIGSYDDRKSTYNLTLNADRTGPGSLLEEPITVSFAEKVKGWSSFKSFIPENGASLNNNYYTFKDGNIWRHHDDTVERNSFYEPSGVGNRTSDSTVTVLLNDDPGSVKSYGTLNYEGSQARITTNLDDSEYYNNEPGDGWYVSNMKTNLQEIEGLEFKDKEDKWFSQIKGVTTELSNVDTREFSVQGIDNASSISYPPISGCGDPTALNYNPNASINDGSCIYCVYGCMTGSLTYPQVNSNYDPLATCDDGSCIKCSYGCTQSGNSNYDPAATCDDGSCLQCVYGCTDPTASNYNTLATCDDGSCVYATNCCDNPNASNYDANCTSPCPGVTIGDYNQMWVNQGSVVWNNSTVYGSPWTGTCGYYWGELVKHDGIIWMTRHTLSSIPHGQEPGNENPIPENGNGLYPNWFKASDFYNQGIIARRCCCEYIPDCTVDPSQQQFNELGAGYWNTISPLGGLACTPIIYGCMDPTALNYYSFAMVEDGNCVY